MTTMPNTPPLLRARPYGPARPTPNDQVCANIRYYLARERMNCLFFATVAGISLTRARHIYHARRNVTVYEVFALAKALDVPLGEFFKEVL